MSPILLALPLSIDDSTSFWAYGDAAEEIISKIDPSAAKPKTKYNLALILTRLKSFFNLDLLIITLVLT